jgi:NAD(P)-dependent dehydrogenase (short-subunit alcohol dehydrogenase family)
MCLIDTRARQIIVAGEASDVKSVLERLSSQLFELADQPIVLGSSVQAVQPHSMLGKIVAVTGGAGGIGLEIAKAFCSAGATVITLDIKPPVQSPSVGFHNNIYELCDVTIQKDVDRCFGKIAAELGGLDIVICNAGAATQGPIGDVYIRDLQKSFDLNFFAHHRVAQAALRIFRQQGMGGLMLFNISNQSVNLGSGFGPYGIAKAAELALMKQYALDHGHEGIRANGVNAGRIRSGLMTDEMIESRSSSRGVGVKEYMTANLLGVEVTSYDVAQAFLHLAAMDKVNAAVLTVDGGAMATSMR